MIILIFFLLALCLLYVRSLSYISWISFNLTLAFHSHNTGLPAWYHTPLKALSWGLYNWSNRGKWRPEGTTPFPRFSHGDKIFSSYLVLINWQSLHYWEWVSKVTKQIQVLQHIKLTPCKELTWILPKILHFCTCCLNEDLFWSSAILTKVNF